MTEERKPPQIENAPGLKWSPRKEGWYAFWQARTDLVKRGYRPATIPLYRGVEPDEVDRTYISETCQTAQAEMLVWGRGGLPEPHDFFTTDFYDGTIASLAYCYQHDPDSRFHKNRYRTRKNYATLISRIVREHGTERVEHLGGRDMQHWHDAWTASGIPMAHSLMRMTRGLFGFGLTLLQCEHCTRMCTVLSHQRYEMGKSGDQQLTAEMATAIRAEAHKQELPAIALAQAIQFEGTFRQKDVIGEWIPESEPGLSDVLSRDKHNKTIKWLCGVRWNEIDANLILRHVTSKRQKPVVVDLRLAPMVLEEFKLIYGFEIGDSRTKLPASGPIIIEARDGLPYHDDLFRQQWRELARACEIPDDVKNMHSRHGAISEATDSGAALEDVRHAAAHSNIQTTQRYSRGTAEKTARTMQSRTAFRAKNKSGT